MIDQVGVEGGFSPRSGLSLLNSPNAGKKRGFFGGALSCHSPKRAYIGRVEKDPTRDE